MTSVSGEKGFILIRYPIFPRSYEQEGRLTDA
jgi:hypothetical protein